MWPFPSVNGVRTPESLALESIQPEKQKSVYDQCIETYHDAIIEEALL